MRPLAITMLLVFLGSGVPGPRGSAAGQTVLCYKKKCAEYPDGTKICELKPVDCDQVQVQ